MTITYNEIIRAKEAERTQGAHREQYRKELYTRYTGKDPAAIVYNGFSVTRPDGPKNFYTIHYRTDNGRPYALYFNGAQMASENTYISRGHCVRALNRIRETIQRARPADIITDIHGNEIIT